MTILKIHFNPQQPLAAPWRYESPAVHHSVSTFAVLCTHFQALIFFLNSQFLLYIFTKTMQTPLLYRYHKIQTKEIHIKHFTILIPNQPA